MGSFPVFSLFPDVPPNKWVRFAYFYSPDNRIDGEYEACTVWLFCVLHGGHEGSPLQKNTRTESAWSRWCFCGGGHGLRQPETEAQTGKAKDNYTIPEMISTFFSSSKACAKHLLDSTL